MRLFLLFLIMMWVAMDMNWVAMDEELFVVFWGLRVWGKKIMA